MSVAIEQGDMSAAELFREHAAFVARFLYRLGVPADAIQDTVQEVFLVVHQRGGYRKGPAKPTSYLAVIAAHAASVQRRKARARASRHDGSQPDDLSTQGAEQERALETRDDLRRLQLALDKLEPDLRATLILADGEDETCASIAEAMGVPVGTVYWRLNEARKKFQRAVSSVDAALSRPRAHQPGRKEASAPVLARGARALGAALGWMTPTWHGSDAEVLLRAAGRRMPIDYPVEEELQRHVEQLGRLAPPAPKSASSLSASSGALKLGLLVTAGAAVLAAAIHAWTPGSAAIAETRVREMRASALRSRDPMAEAPTTNARAEDSPSNSPARDGAAHARAPQGVESRRKSRERYDASADVLSVNTTGNGTRARRGTSGLARSAATNTTPERAAPEDDSSQEPAREAPAQASSPSTEGVAEAEALGRAERVLRKDPAQALSIARQVALHSRSAYLAEEREYIEVMALCGLAKRADAERAAKRFLAAYPQSVFSEPVKAARSGACDTP